MGWNINRIVIVGRIASDIKLNRTNNGTDVCNFRLAVNNKPGKDGEDNVVWIDITCYGNTAVNTAKFCQKGRLIIIEGHLDQKTWIDKENKKHVNTFIIAERIEFTPNHSMNRDNNKPSYNQKQEPAPEENISEKKYIVYGGAQPKDNSFYDNTSFFPEE